MLDVLQHRVVPPLITTMLKRILAANKDVMKAALWSVAQFAVGRRKQAPKM